jgi:mRNA-degrading endonuclease RelE of RelBE toxin-antitoxin system
MAYSIDFSPSAKDMISSLDTSSQRQIVTGIEEAADKAKMKGTKEKRLRRVQLDNFRLVYLEIHPSQQIIVLKIADKNNLRDWLLEKPELVQSIDE